MGPLDCEDLIFGTNNTKRYRKCKKINTKKNFKKSYWALSKPFYEVKNDCMLDI